MADILENPVDLIDDAYEQEIQVEQEMIEVVAYRSYNRLDDKPQINGVELVGNKTSSDLGITAQIESAVNSEAQARAQADNTLQGKIDTEKLARQQADSTLQGNIDAEETARKAADKDIQDVLDGETLARQNADTALGGRIDTEIHDRQVADIGLQGQIDAITSKSDVVDVVATYADLQAYDTQHLGDNDVIKVLDDETHGDALTYYRWSKTNQTWTFIGQEAPYYSKSQTDTLLLGKQNTIDSSHKLSADLVDDTSATNKFVTASDITNWNGKQDALTAGTGIDITGGVISTPAIVPEVVAELPTTGAEGKLYLTPKAHTTQTATGNPIEATITAQAGQLESFQLDGDTYQQASPSPDYPQQIQTVTGQQTVSINGTNYPISLGSIELCKLGTYQDYIYKDGDEWKVHKATKKVLLNSSEGWTYAGQTNVYYSAGITGYALSGNVPFSDCLKGIDNVSGAAGMSSSADNSIAFIGSTAATRLYIKSSTLGGDSTGANLRAWLSTHNVSLYYALATPTDTTITDTTLIAQLEAIRTASLENGTNTITNTATGTNLAGNMEIGYFEFNPTNRYDKFIWLDINNNYEQIGGE